MLQRRELTDYNDVDRYCWHGERRGEEEADTETSEEGGAGLKLISSLGRRARGVGWRFVGQLDGVEALCGLLSMVGTLSSRMWLRIGQATAFAEILSPPSPFHFNSTVTSRQIRAVQRSRR